MDLTLSYLLYVGCAIGGLVLFFSPEKVSNSPENYTKLRATGILICAAITDFAFGTGYFGIFLLAGIIAYGIWYMFKGVRDE